MQHVRVSSHQAPVLKLGDSHMTLSPKFRLAVIQSSSFLHPKLGSESNLGVGGGGPLIPGLPDDLALDCLLRLPIESHRACRAVCKRWHLLLGSRERFFTGRKQLGYHDPWIYIFAFHKGTDKTQCHVLDLTNYAWHMIPPLPCKELFSPRGFRSVGIPHEGTLLVCGGVVSDRDSPTDFVLKYEVHKNRWSAMSRMNAARSFFASGMIDGLVYVAGGNSSGLLELDSAEVLDLSEENWRPISNMGMNMAAYDAAVLKGKLLVTEGWLWPFMYSPRGQVFDPISNAWEPMSVGLREGWTGSSVVVGEHLFVVSELEKSPKLKIYDPETDSWDIVLGAPIPEQIRKPFSVCSADFRIFIVGSGLHVAVGHLKKLKLQCSTLKEWSCFVEWEVVSAPEALCELMPSSSQILYA